MLLLVPHDPPPHPSMPDNLPICSIPCLKNMNVYVGRPYNQTHESNTNPLSSYNQTQRSYNQTHKTSTQPSFVRSDPYNQYPTLLRTIRPITPVPTLLRTIRPIKPVPNPPSYDQTHTTSTQPSFVQSDPYNQYPTFLRTIRPIQPVPNLPSYNQTHTTSTQPSFIQSDP